MREGYVAVVTSEPNFSQTEQEWHCRKRKKHRQKSQDIEEACSSQRFQAIQSDLSTRYNGIRGGSFKERDLMQ